MSSSCISLHIEACTMSMSCVVVFCTLDGDAELLVRDSAAARPTFYTTVSHRHFYNRRCMYNIYGCNMLLSVFYTLKLTSGLTFTFVVLFSV